MSGEHSCHCRVIQIRVPISGWSWRSISGWRWLSFCRQDGRSFCRQEGAGVAIALRLGHPWPVPRPSLGASRAMATPAPSCLELWTVWGATLFPRRFYSPYYCWLLAAGCWLLASSVIFIDLLSDLPPAQSHRDRVRCSRTGPSAAGMPQPSYRDVFTACPGLEHRALSFALALHSRS